MTEFMQTLYMLMFFVESKRNFEICPEWFIKYSRLGQYVVDPEKFVKDHPEKERK